jgi:putative PIN family toxin of toxin-antitoxin system
VRVFLDTNVLVSAYVARGLSADLMRLVLAEHDLVTAALQLAEFTRVLENKIGASAAEARRVATELSRFSGPAPPEPHPAITTDPDDAWILAASVSADADLLVSGDAHVLAAAKRVKRPRIVSVREAWTTLRATRP